MPKKKSKQPLPPVAALPEEARRWLEQVVTGPMTAEAVEEVMRGFKKALIERALQAEMSHHLGYAVGEEKPEASANQRNGTSGKTVLTDDGPLRIDIPRDRAGQFEPQLIGKHERRFTGFDDKIIAMYARGMSVREIQAFLVQMYNTEVSPDFISQVTDAVMDEVLQWQGRPLEAVYPRITLQTCIVHLLRNSLSYAGYKERKGLAEALKPIYQAVSAEAAEAALEAFAEGEWGQRFPTITLSWRRAWEQVIPFFAFPPEVRRVIYTTNAIESLNAGIRKIIKTRGHFPTDEAATKLIWLALRNITAEWKKPMTHWKAAMNQFAILYTDRFIPAMTK